MNGETAPADLSEGGVVFLNYPSPLRTLDLNLTFRCETAQIFAICANDSVEELPTSPIARCLVILTISARHHWCAYPIGTPLALLLVHAVVLLIMACSSPLPVPKRTVTVLAPETADAASAPDEVQSDDELDSPIDQQQAQQVQPRRSGSQPESRELDLDWERGGGSTADSGGTGWLQRIPLAVPAIAAAAAVLLLLRAAFRGRGGAKSGSGSRGRAKPRQHHKTSTSADAAASPAAAPPEELPEPEPTLEVYASPFAETPQPAPQSGVLPLLGLRLAVSEHIAAKVRL